MNGLHGAEVIHGVRAEIVRYRWELRLYALCRSGSGAWLVSIAPFEELFFDERLVCGRSVQEALARLERRYAHCRRLVALR
jgi:hypothetical protein